jgi:hypothetical protein
VELPREVLRDRVPLDEAGEQALAEQLHHRFSVPALEGVKGAVFGESPVGQQEMRVGMPLDQVSGGGDGDDDSGPSVRTELLAHVLGEALGGAVRELEEKLSTLAEDAAQQPWHGENDVPMRDGREDLLLQPLRPQELALLLA